MDFRKVFLECAKVFRDFVLVEDILSFETVKPQSLGQRMVGEFATAIKVDQNDLLRLRFKAGILCTKSSLHIIGQINCQDHMSPVP